MVGGTNRGLFQIAALSAMIVACMALQTRSGAQLFKVAGDSGLIQLVTPASVDVGVHQNNRNFFWLEEQKNVDVDNLRVDLGPRIDGPVNSYLLYTDTRQGPRSYDIALQFDETILGIITSTRRLNRTDSLLGLPGTIYPTGDGARGQEDADGLFWDPVANQILILNETHGNIDEVRVITQAVPEPGAAALLAGAALSGLAACRRRRRA
jgi:hypothetical protein